MAPLPFSFVMTSVQPERTGRLEIEFLRQLNRRRTVDIARSRADGGAIIASGRGV